MNNKVKTVSVTAGLYADERDRLRQLAEACNIARGSVRLYCARLLRDHIAKACPDGHVIKPKGDIP